MLEYSYHYGSCVFVSLTGNTCRSFPSSLFVPFISFVPLYLALVPLSRPILSRAPLCRTQSKLACVRGLLRLKEKKYKQAAREFLDVDVVMQGNFAEVRRVLFVWGRFG